MQYILDLNKTSEVVKSSGKIIGKEESFLIACDVTGVGPKKALHIHSLKLKHTLITRFHKGF